MLGLLAVLGYLAIAARIQPRPHYGFNSAVPALFDTVFPPWFADIALAAIAIGALVPAAMMALAAGNLFTRNLYRELIRPGAGPTEQTRVARSVSLLVKCGAVGFVVAVPATFVINFQLVAGVWILQTLPTVFLWLLRRRPCTGPTLVGWAAGTALGTFLLVQRASPPPAMPSAPGTT